MTSQTLLYIIISAIVALILVLFMYGYKSKYSKKASWTYGFLRFITLFSILLLLINPKFKKETYTIKKPYLPVLIDNSASIKELNQNEKVGEMIDALKNNETLNESFNISYFSFGNEIKALDSLTFQDKNTQIATALLETNSLFENEVAPMILLSDGNQTLGTDYEFIAPKLKNTVYPLIVGDSIQSIDLKIEQLNTNRYAYLKNNFPVEIMMVYQGEEAIQTLFEIKQGNQTVFRETVSFSKQETSKTLSITLPATSVGLQQYVALLQPLSEEKNTTNNSKQFAVEVIDQATNVIIVSKISHPDIGALQKAISSNEQRTVEIKKPSESVSILNDYQLVILFQPDREFAAVYSELKKLGKNTLTVTGLETDWNFLNVVQSNYIKEVTPQIEQVEGVLNSNYGAFALEDIGFNDFRPLKTLFGELQMLVQNELLIEQSIDGFTTQSPLLATVDINGQREAILDGEGFWRWRAQSYLNNNSFEDFDNFIGKLVQYLASNVRKSRLTVSAETFYYNNIPIKVSAQYFDENYIFDPRTSLQIQVTHNQTNESYELPMLLKNNFFEVDLSHLPAGDYSFSVSDSDRTVSRAGTFTILEFNVEQQFLNANVTKLKSLATNTSGASFFIDQNESLIQVLLNDNRYQQIQVGEEKITPLIDWYYLLALIILTLSIEWFLRKYNGLV